MADDDQDIEIDGRWINPRLHLLMHVVAARQIIADDPPEMYATIRRLLDSGRDHHEALHMVCGVVAKQVHAAMTHQRYDHAAHRARAERPAVVVGRGGGKGAASAAAAGQEKRRRGRR